MFPLPQKSHRKMTIVILSLCTQIWNPASAQNYSTQVANLPPLGLMGFFPGGDGVELGLVEDLKGGFTFGLGAQTTYDSNFFLDENSPESEQTTEIIPQLYYTTDPEGGAPCTVTANYTPTFRSYLNNSDLNVFDQSGGVTLKLEGSKTRIKVYGKYDEFSGADRLSREFVNGSVLRTGVEGSYQIASRTSLIGGLTAAVSDYSTGNVTGSEIYTARVGSFWSATERFSFGPSVRYSSIKSDNTGNRDAWALLMQARYRAGERFGIMGSLGVESSSSSRDSGSNKTNLTGDLTARYDINERWAWTNAIRYVTVPSPTEVNYIVNNLAVSTQLDREFLRATLGMGLDLNVSDYVGVGTVVTVPDTENNLGAFVSYRRNIFSERLAFDSRLRYAVNRGDADWDQLQITVGLNLKF